MSGYTPSDYVCPRCGRLILDRRVVPRSPMGVDERLDIHDKVCPPLPAHAEPSR